MCTSPAHHHLLPSTSQCWHPGSMHPAECCHSYPILQWPAAVDTPHHSWGSKHHGRISPLAKGPPQLSPVWSTPGTSDTVHIHTHNEFYNGTCNIIMCSVFTRHHSDDLVQCTPTPCSLYWKWFERVWKVWNTPNLFLQWIVITNWKFKKVLTCGNSMGPCIFPPSQNL